MRIYLLLASAAMLSACGGGAGVQTVGGSATGTGAGTTTTTGTFVAPTEVKTYSGLGVAQHYEYYTRSDSSGQGGQLYAGDANTVRDSGISVTYNPRDAIFDLTIQRTKANVTVTGDRFQDPAHRTDFGGALQPQGGVPNLNLPSDKGIQYLQSGSSSGNLLATYAGASTYRVGDQGYSSTTQTFFYQKPGTTTKYVTYAGYVRNTLSVTQATDAGSSTPYLRNNYSLDRALFVYGESTNNSAVPTSGTGTYTGDMLATVVFNPLLDSAPNTPTYMQWISGTQTSTVDFGKKTVATTLSGTVSAPAFDAYTNGTVSLPAGSTFTAHANSTIDLVGKGGFTGSFADASFVRPGMSTFNVVIAGSSIDGGFYGPNGEEIGAGYRIVGGTPDQRIDILGILTGKK
ncbi:transferrin-binding protein-like solute binding protein [Sphingomonas sp. AR_OL41]|uniref:transferrin-binding protein-like solute binding protein n=1 Tax=Sphingomonas sp. AR_OL41 TaxID=3042729 RepID=UPI0024801985|nr:transferrin-binding protein-like solute binding protein [Sphingomonas sp. AR_OL41]MDH7971477.1 transferrin-binding protein-like solute binding protein [Sphingomonas sp. AR_OL41]